MSGTSDKARQSGGRTTLLGLLLIGILLLAIVILLNLRQTLLNSPTATPTYSPDVAGITPLEPGVELADFALPASTGEDMSLSDFRGSYVLMFFGYTHCPDFCPTTMANFKLIKEDLGADAAQVEFVLVSVDGERDTPEVLAEYLGRFDPAFIGLQGNDETLAEIGGDFGLDYVLHTDEADEDGNYAVDHTTFSYLIDPEGRLRTLFSYSADRDAVTAYIRSLIEGDAA